jgi:hypothetical protein
VQEGEAPLLRFSKPALLLVLLFAAVFPPSLLHADDFQLLPSVAEKVEYIDNIFLAPTGSSKVNDFISTTSAGLHLLDNTEQLNIDFTGRVDQLFYLDNPSLNSTDQFYNGSLAYAFSPNFTLAFKGVYNRASSPDEFLYTSGLVLYALRTEVSSENITGNYALTDKTAASLSYEHGEYWYKNYSADDATYDASNLSFLRDMTDVFDNLKGTLSLGYTRYNFTGLTVDNYEARLGLQYAIKEKWSLIVNGGARYTGSSFQVAALTGYFIGFNPASGLFYLIPTFASQSLTTTGTGPVGSATLSYTGETTTANLTFSRDVMPAYGSMGAVESTAVIGSVSRKFTYELSGSFWAGYYTNISKAQQYSLTAFDYTTWNAGPSIRYDFNKDMYLEGSYIFTKLDNNTSSGYTAYRDYFMLRFFLQHAIMQ